MSEHTAEKDAPRLSESQVLALAEVADGVEGFAHSRTLSSLQRRGLVVRTRIDWRITATGRAALADAEERWPILFRVIPPGSTQDGAA